VKANITAAFLSGLLFMVTLVSLFLTQGANPVGRGAPRGGDFRGGRPSRGGPRGRGRGGPRGGYHQPPAAAPYGECREKVEKSYDITFIF